MSKKKMKVKIRKPSKTLAARLNERRVIRDGVVHVGSLDEIPKAWETQYEDMSVSIDKDLYEPTTEELIDEAMKTFARWFRSLNTDVRYYVEKRIRKKVCKDLSLNELEEIMSRFQAAMKGWNGPEDKNKKPV